MPEETLTITDNRTGSSYTVPVKNGAIRAMDLRQIKTSADDFGLVAYDPAFTNTACCESRITYIDGDKGILEYRGYPIEQLAGRCSFLEVAYLLLNGELPTSSEYEGWTDEIRQHRLVHEGLKTLMGTFYHNAHPMGMLASSVAALSTFYPESRQVHDPAIRRTEIGRLIAKMPSMAAYAYRHNLGLPFVYPDDDLSYTENFMNMLWRRTETKYKPNPILARALDVLFILHADHEQNCSANAMRSVGSSLADPYLSTAAAIAALSGPLHGGANEEVLRMLDEIGSKDRVPEYIKKVKAGECKLMGFGHRVYKNYDPRARIIRQIATEVFEVTGTSPKLDIAIELERIALEDEYFVKRKLYPNVDFYSGIIYQALGFRPELFTVLFAIPRTAGWLAQWQELLEDPAQKIARPRQVFLGHRRRDFVPMNERGVEAVAAGADAPWSIRRAV
ncbi:MAG TPA: citrate synthase [Bryobacteraceae bacterium]|nr:citrate synthase [Bryobacteraceae bacterium]